MNPTPPPRPDIHPGDLLVVAPADVVLAAGWRDGHGPLYLRLVAARWELAGYYADHLVWVEGVRLTAHGASVGWYEALVRVAGLAPAAEAGRTVATDCEPR